MNTKDALIEQMQKIKEDLMKQRCAVEASYRYSMNLVLSGETDPGLLAERDRLARQRIEVDAKIHYVLEVSDELKNDTFVLERMNDDA